MATVIPLLAVYAIGWLVGYWTASLVHQERALRAKAESRTKRVETKDLYPN